MIGTTTTARGDSKIRRAVLSLLARTAATLTALAAAIERAGARPRLDASAPRPEANANDPTAMAEVEDGVDSSEPLVSGPERHDLLAPAVEGLPACKASPTGEIVKIYVAGCAGFLNLSKVLQRAYGLPASQAGTFKIGVVTRRRAASEADGDLDLLGRIAALGADRYGSITVDGSGAVRRVEGHAAWRLCPWRIARAPYDARIRVAARALEVALPVGVSIGAFDRAFAQALGEMALFRRFPRHARFTAYADLGRDRHRDLAREIYVGLDPIRNGDVILAVVERILTALGQMSGRSRQWPSHLRPQVTDVERQQTMIIGHDAEEFGHAQGRESSELFKRLPVPMNAAQRRAMFARKRAAR